MKTTHNMLISAVLLGLFAIAGVMLVTGTFNLTGDKVAENKRQYELHKLHELISNAEYDNQLEADTILVSDPLLTRRQPVKIYRARKNGKAVAAILTCVAPDGYSGKIELLVAVRVDGTLIGTRVLEHKETPGLGDAIEANKSDWILKFSGLSVQTQPKQWRVKKDGGEFDQITSATITSRAVLKAVHAAVKYYQQHQQEIFAMPNQP